MLGRVKRTKLARALGDGLSRAFCKSNLVVLYPSKTPIFPLQTYITDIKEEDKLMINRLGAREAGVFYRKPRSEEEVLPDAEMQKFLELFQKAKQEADELLSTKLKDKEGQADASGKERKKKLLPPKVPPMNKEHLRGQGLAMTLDENFQEFYNLGEKIDESAPFPYIKNLSDVHEVGSLCKLTITQQNIHQRKRNLMTLEGIERIRLVKQLDESQLIEYFEKNRQEKINDLKENIENVSKLRMNAQLTENTPETLKK